MALSLPAVCSSCRFDAACCGLLARLSIAICTAPRSQCSLCRTGSVAPIGNVPSSTLGADSDEAVAEVDSVSADCILWLWSVLTVVGVSLVKMEDGPRASVSKWWSNSGQCSCSLSSLECVWMGLCAHTCNCFPHWLTLRLSTS
jgi:hypothetical protein